MIALSVITLSFTSCSDDDSSTLENENQEQNENENPAGYAMTVKINGVLHNMQSIFGGNHASSSIYTAYPDEDYIFLQGSWVDSPFAKEIDIFISRDDLQPGTYYVNQATYETATHIDLIDNTNSINETTVSGQITITEVDTSAKTVKGTFEFDTADYPQGEENPTVNYHLTEGTFSYEYDVE
ncbi:hypothetical protein GCM10007424_12740 [Flavobacterium suaedae]|uniref:DUF4382 domain-containing protein n=2 Tax=Flavobacterium suaedae TaxID=1767027 RepID=A0ABQ1JTC8_9FLAO|nr:hypothetical protein GCM10007424_12740 [Flavobacterium suaedae]